MRTPIPMAVVPQSIKAAGSIGGGLFEGCWTERAAAETRSSLGRIVTIYRDRPVGAQYSTRSIGSRVDAGSLCSLRDLCLLTFDWRRVGSEECTLS